MAKGRWIVLSCDECPNSEQYPLDVTLSRRKMNRTTDAFSVKLDLPEAVTETSHGVYIEVCQKLDGGCKRVMAFDEPSFCEFAKEYAKRNFIDILNKMGLDDCPIPKGLLEMEDYVFNYEELPENGLIGEFVSTVFLVKDGARVACVIVDTLFDEYEDNDE